MLAQRATWRSGDAADCKSAHPGSIPGVASSILPEIQHLPIPLARMARQRRRACWDNFWDNRSVFFLTARRAACRRRADRSGKYCARRDLDEAVHEIDMVGEAPNRDKMLRPAIMVPPLLWLLSDEARAVNGNASSPRTGHQVAGGSSGRESWRADRLAQHRADANRTDLKLRSIDGGRIGRSRGWT